MEISFTVVLDARCPCCSCKSQKDYSHINWYTYLWERQIQFCLLFWEKNKIYYFCFSDSSWTV